MSYIWTNHYLHGLHEFHAGPIPEFAETVREAASRTPLVGPLAGWGAYALVSGVAGLVIGGVIVWVVHLVKHRLERAAH